MWHQVRLRLYSKSLLTRSVYCNSLILNGVKNKGDVALLSEERHAFLLKAVNSAETLMAVAFRGEQGKQVSYLIEQC